MPAPPPPLASDGLFALVGALRDGVVVVDTDGRHRFVNGAFERMVGWSADELLGTGVPHPYWPPEHIDEITASFVDLQDGQPKPLHSTFRRRNEERFPVLVRPAFVPYRGRTFFIATVRDLTEEEAQRSALAQSKQLVDTLVEGGELAWWMWHLAEAWEEVSDSYFTMLGYPPGAWAASYEEWAKRVHPDDIGGADASMKALLEDRARLYEAEHRMLDAHGEWRWVLARGYVVERTATGAPACVIGTVQDTHRLKLQELRLAQFNKMEVVGQMAGGIAHDFNNILTVLTGNFEMLRDEVSESEHECLTEIDEVLDRAASLTQALLQFARPGSSAVEKILLSQLLLGAERMVRSSLPPRYQIEWALAEEDGFVVADPGRVQNAVLNLVINARDAIETSGRGQRLTLGTGWEAIDARGAARWDVDPGIYGLVYVQDDGPGMPAEVRERAFEPLFSTKPTGKGTGLGLSMVRRCAVDSSGGVRLTSEPGQGTRVEILIPQLETTDVVVERDAEDISPPRGAGERVLLVDDEPSVLRVVEMALRRLGYEVVPAENPRRALAYLQSEPFDLLLTDVVMPHTIDGIELARRVRSLRAGLPVIFMSGYMDDRQSREIRSLGPILRKPFSTRALADAVRKLVPSGG